MNKRSAISLLAVATAIATVASLPAAGAVGDPICDFDGDGYSDLAIGSPLEPGPSEPGDGGINVIDGSPDGLNEIGDQYLRFTDLGVNGNASGFGASMACGDFNADGKDDLAVGAPLSPIPPTPSAGAVIVLYGSNGGLRDWVLDPVFISRDTPGVNGSPKTGDRFGASVAAGDFDDDGDDDLAIGIPGATVSGVNGAGAVYVMQGSSSGVTTSGDQMWHRKKSGVPGGLGEDDGFGTSLTVGDFDGNGYADLATGAPFGDANGVPSGYVVVLYGVSGGLDGADSDVWHRGKRGVLGKHEQGRFGWNVAAADFDDDGRDDLAISDHEDRVNGVHLAGSVNILYGKSHGIGSGGDALFHRDKPSVMGELDSAFFGDALYPGDFNGNGKFDLAIGAPKDSIQEEEGGSITVLNGKGSGLSAQGDQLWAQFSDGIPGADEANDLFGDTLGVGDFNGDGYDDVVVGVTGEVVSGVVGAGRVVVIYGSADKLTSDGAQSWSRNSSGIQGETGCHGFGALLNYWDDAPPC